MTHVARALAALTVLFAALPAVAAPKESRRGGATLEGVLNLNQASASELMLLPGVGPAKARRILEWRQKRPFRRVEDLTRVKGFGRKTLSRLRPHLAVSGQTTLRRVPAPTPRLDASAAGSPGAQAPDQPAPSRGAPPTTSAPPGMGNATPRG